jgi:hypothetical protein
MSALARKVNINYKLRRDFETDTDFENETLTLEFATSKIC